jgi:hypothetical protein
MSDGRRRRIRKRARCFLRKRKMLALGTGIKALPKAPVKEIMNNDAENNLRTSPGYRP